MPTALTVCALVAAAVAALAVAAIGAGPVRADQPPPSTTAPTTSTPTTSTPTTTTPAGPPVAVQISRTPVGRQIASGFLGFSFEYPAVRAYTGADPQAINPVLVQLIRNLNPHQSPVLRIGGNSADETWWPARRVSRSPGIRNTLNRSWLATTRALAVQTGGRLILDFNLKLNSAAEITAEAKAFRAGIGSRYIDAFEIGNEPELYPITPFYYHGPQGTPVYPRSHNYHPADYLREMARFAPLLKGSALAGPATGSFFWLQRLPGLFTAEPSLKVVTYHRYPLIKCFTKPGDPGYPTIPNLLSADASRKLLDGAGPEIALTHARGATFRVDELNSVACKGQTGVSDTFASSLWMLDTLFAMARAGVDGVNIHTLPEAVYAPFTFQNVNGRWRAAVQPEYYGLLMFTQAAPVGSRLLSVATPSDPDIRVRAARTPQGVIHVVLINDDLTSDHVIQLPAPAGTGPGATVERLSAPSADATGGVTLGGQSFGDATDTGTLTGPRAADQLTPVNGQYQIDLPATSAAMLTFSPA